MPVDGFKVTVKNRTAALRILCHRELHFKKIIDGETGEDTNRYERLRSNHLSYIPLPSGEMVIWGNLFQFYSGSNNVGDFSFEDMVAALNSFCEYHNVEAKEIEVNKLEVGFNIASPRSASDILADIVTYRYRTKEVSTYGQTGLSAAFSFDDYRLLFYDKGKKHRLRQDLFRVELVAKNGLLKGKGIKSFEDLYDIGKISSLILHLRKCIQDMVFTDRAMDQKRLTAKDLALFQKYRTCEEWTELAMYSPDSTRKVRKRYQKLLEEYGSNHTQKWMLQSLDEAAEKHGLVKCGKEYHFSAVDKSGKSVTLTG